MLILQTFVWYDIHGSTAPEGSILLFSKNTVISNGMLEDTACVHEINNDEQKLVYCIE